MDKIINYEYRRIPFKDIDFSNEECRISHKCAYADLEKSIGANGIINPVIVYSHGAKFNIISGFKRAGIAAAINAAGGGEKNGEGCTGSIGCLIADDIPPVERLLINIRENASIRELNPVEISAALKKLSAFYDKAELIENYLPLINMQKSEYIFNKYLSLDRLTPDLKTAVVRGRVPAAAAFTLAEFSGAAQAAFASIINETRMGANLIVETARLIFETTMQYNKTAELILSDINYEAVLANKELTTNQKTEAIRGALSRLKRPMYESRMERFSDLACAFTADKISINPFAYFEKDEITIKFSIDSAASLEKKIEALKRLKDSKLISEFLKKAGRE